MKVEDGTLWIRSGAPADALPGRDAAPACRAAMATSTPAILVELQGGRYYFRGRKGGVINVGGLKVYPEEVESVLNADPRVRMSLVRARRNPITGAVVVADVVLDDRRHGRARSARPKASRATCCRHAAAPCPHTRCPPCCASCPRSSSPPPANWCVPVRNVIVTGGSRGLGPRDRGALGSRAIASSPSRAAPARSSTAASRAASDSGRGAIEFRACDLSDLDAHRPLGARAAHAISARSMAS